MAQRFYPREGSQSAIETERTRFFQLINHASLGELSRISEQTKDPWQLEQLSMCRYPSVRSDAMASEYISRDVLKSRIEYGMMPSPSRDGPTIMVDVGLSFAGLMNPLIFRSDNLTFFAQTVDSVLATDEIILIKAITKNPAATAQVLGIIYREETGILSRSRDNDIIKNILLHPNTPAEIKLKHAKSEVTRFDDEMFRNAAIQSLRDSAEKTP